MNNGTAATHCLFLGLKYKYPNIHKIYVPNNVFIACWNCVLMVYSKNELEVMKLNYNTLNIDTNEEYIKSLDKNSCILVVHNLGNIINVPRLKRLRPDIIFIEDNCEGFFGKYENEYTGCSESTLCSSVSFYANKTLTTGEGGGFFTNDKNVYEYIKSIYSHGMTNERYIHKYLAYNYRMTNVQAGFLKDQLSDIDHILQLKKTIFNNYDNNLQHLFNKNILKKINCEDSTECALWMYCIIIPNISFKNLENYMKKKLIEIRPFFYDIRKHTHLQDIVVNYDECDIFNYGVMLPCYPELKIDQQEYICKCIDNYINMNI